MKKFLLPIASVLILGGIFIFNFYWRQLRGIGPAVNRPERDVSVLIGSKDNPFYLPEGFSISVFARDLKSPRVMAWDPVGNLIVSLPLEGRVVALPDKNGDGVADESLIVAEGLNRPHGLATRCDKQGITRCKLYIAETDQVAVYDYDELNLKAVNKKKIADLPGGGIHYTRTILSLPSPDNDKLLISVGSDCNVCDEEDWRRAKILVVDTDLAESLQPGSLKVFAAGLRNSVFMTAHPVTGKIWATEMGRDLLGDDLPPDEINIIEEGKNYGWPICYGQNIHDTEFDKKTYIRNPCLELFEASSYIDIPAHSAPLGLAFIPEEGWPQEYWHNLLVAYHGSWNRSVPTGYKVVRYKFDFQGNYLGSEDFITGWLENNEAALGRPVDILVQPGGRIYISDDKAGVIYLVKYKVPLFSRSINKANMIKVNNPKPDSLVRSPLVVDGQARGLWFFEASFPIQLLDENGEQIAIAVAETPGDWMTNNFISFKATLKFSMPKTERGMLVLKKDNPSGLPEHDDELRIPVRFK